MSNKHEENLSEAIAALTRAAQGIQNRCMAVEDEKSSLNRERKSYLADSVRSVLPDVTMLVLKNLRIAHPDFVTPEVEKAFKSQRKFLWIFQRPGRESVLAQLQTRAASYLDEIQYGNLKQIDAELHSKELLLKKLWQNYQETFDLVQLLTKAAQKQASLPDDVRQKLSSVAGSIFRHDSTSASAIRAKKASHQNFSSSSGNTSTPVHSSADVDGYDDLLIYLATDFPVSARTLMLSAIESQRVESVSSAPARHSADSFGGESGNYRSADPIESSGTHHHDGGGFGGGTAAGLGIGVGLGVAGAAVAGVVGSEIATDDRLGNFS
ncbi:hypothetical protein [Pseudomonas putida]|uniref:Uncharacterized protein n=1 Tax=Pseudomonas putida TaxID=303 RepID=A0A8I1E9Y0_PSEPU|nr:hypothetical protein [Pseudomonas putida]MBI6882525.1 hypothetical protein [Pseudomonas putida]